MALVFLWPSASRVPRLTKSRWSKRRQKVERLFAWLQSFRRLVKRYEYHAENFLGSPSSAALPSCSGICEMTSNVSSTKKSSDAKISVITATYNAVEYLPMLIESLRSQSDQDFEWVVADGGSEDGTLGLLHSISDIRITITAQPDFGIYDALNRAIKVSTGSYYVVIGADDVFYPNAIENFKQHILPETDIVAANIEIGGTIVRPGRGKSWLFGQSEFVAGHAVGTVFRKDLHEQYGLYSRHFPILADQLFTKTCCQGGANINIANFESGCFGLKGVSSTDTIGYLSEFFRVQLMTEKYKFPQFVLYLIRLIKHYSKF